MREKRALHRRLGVQHYIAQCGSITVAVLDGMAEYRRLEHYGVHLIEWAHFTLRDALATHPGEPAGWRMPQSTPHGPGFDFATSRTIFCGRRGIGPLHVAWDTNILIDYFQYGAEMWKVGDYPPSLDDDFVSHLECLQLIIALWVIRDIRFVVLPEVVDDAKKQLSVQRRRERENALHEYTSALRLISSDDPEEEIVSRDGLLELPESVRELALQEVPAGLDQRMVAAAHRSGAHVFLTRDRGVLRAQKAFRPLGLLITSPGGLLESLIGAGAFNCVLAPGLAYWPLPDQQRVAHLIRALPDYDL